MLALLRLLLLVWVWEVRTVSADVFDVRDVADQVRGCASACESILRVGIEAGVAAADELTRTSAGGCADNKAGVDEDRRGRMTLGSNSAVDCNKAEGGKVNDRGGGVGGVRNRATAALSDRPERSMRPSLIRPDRLVRYAELPAVSAESITDRETSPGAGAPGDERSEVDVCTGATASDA